jgi:prolyl 4-hydroxylase
MNNEVVLDKRLLEWLRQRVDLACDLSESLEAMRKQGLSDETIIAAIDAVRPRGDALADGAPSPPLIRRHPSNLHKIDNPNLELYTLDNFLSAKECARLIALISHHLRPSTVAYTIGDSSFRTSQTSDLCHLRSPVALAIDAKICKTLGIRAEYSEGVQAQRYDVGQQFKPHWDYFIPDTDTYRRLGGVRGNRTWTFMVYLNDGLEGGATRFTKIDLAFAPRAGTALLWNNLHADGSPNEFTMHCGEPVISGHKIIITKWFRVHGHGPVFHE